jgi:outer membrane cobalamin receptor
MLVFVNADQIQSRGIELGVGMNRGHGYSGQLTYSLQQTQDRATGIELTNSPRQMAKVVLRAPLRVKDMTAGLDAQYVSDRRTLAGGNAPSYVLTNVSVLAPRTFGWLVVSATIYNVLGVKYTTPAPDGFPQDVLQQDGRNFRVRTTLHY